MSGNVNASRTDPSVEQSNNGTPKTPTRDENFFEYYEEDSPIPSRPQSITEEYVLANPSENPIDSQDTILQPRRSRQVIQDEYDEDNYTLARDSNDGTVSVSPDNNNGDTPFGCCALSKNKKVVGFVAVLLVVSIIGCVLFKVVVLTTFGKSTIDNNYDTMTTMSTTMTTMSMSTIMSVDNSEFLVKFIIPFFKEYKFLYTKMY